MRRHRVSALFAAAAAACLASASAQTPSCVFEFPDPILQRYNLTTLQAASPILIPGLHEDYQFGICKLVQCNGRNGIYSMVDPFSKVCLQAFGDIVPVSSQPLIPQNPSQGIQVSYTGGFCQSLPGRNWTVNYNVNCSTSPLSHKQVSFLDGCTVLVEMSDPSGCGTATAPTGGKTKTAPLSGGWVFIIFLLVASIVYLGGGMAYKRLTVGASGAEALPNIDFWRATRANVSAGAQWVYCTITCQPMPNLSGDEDLGYHGIRHDDLDDEADGQTVKRFG